MRYKTALLLAKIVSEVSNCVFRVADQLGFGLGAVILLAVNI